MANLAPQQLNEVFKSLEDDSQVLPVEQDNRGAALPYGFQALFCEAIESNEQSEGVVEAAFDFSSEGVKGPMPHVALHPLHFNDPVGPVQFEGSIDLFAPQAEGASWVQVVSKEEVSQKVLEPTPAPHLEG